jgi:hypothetical protein
VAHRALITRPSLDRDGGGGEVVARLGAAEGLVMKPVGEPDAENLHVRLDEQGEGKRSVAERPKLSHHPRPYHLRHHTNIRRSPLSGVNRTTLLALSSSQFDPRATNSALRTSGSWLFVTRMRL